VTLQPMHKFYFIYCDVDVALFSYIQTIFNSIQFKYFI